MPASASLSENLWAAGPDTFAGNCEHGNSEKVYRARVPARILFVAGTRGDSRRNFVTPAADRPLPRGRRESPPLARSLWTYRIFPDWVKFADGLQRFTL